MKKHVVFVDLFESNVYLFICNRKEMISYLEKKCEIPSEEEIGKAVGFTFRFIGYNNVDYGYGIWIEKFDKTVESYSVLAHECIHVADFILKDRQIKEQDENNEMLAYTFDFIYKKLLKKIRNRRKK